MPISNFPRGFGFGVNIRGIPVLNTYAGSVLWVDGVNGSDGNKGTFDRPLATIAKALTFCTANAGDTIILKPKHAETITAAAGIDLNVAGVAVVGLGVRAQRPTITFTTANTATLKVSAADVSLQNILLVGNFMSIATAIDVTATGFSPSGVEFRDTDATHGFLRAIKATGAANTADGLTVVGCKRLGLSTSGAEMISIVDNIDKLTLTDNVSISAGTSACFVLSAGSKVVTNADIGRNRVQSAATAGNLFISNGGAANTGLVYDNYIGNLDVTGAQTFGAATGLQFFENYTTSTSTEAGALAQAADTPLT